MNSEDPAAPFTGQGVEDGPDGSVDSETADTRDDLRSRMISRFEQWLDQTLADEPPPRGVPDYLLSDAAAVAAGDDGPETETDLYTLFSGLTALTGEIRLQGRALKQLTDLLSPLSETPQALDRLADAIEAGNLDAPGVPVGEVHALMIDLFDRLQRGLLTCDEGIQALRAGAKVSWWRRLFSQPASEAAVSSVQAIREAGTLTLARLQAAMQQWGVQRIGKTGDPFDPDRMTAVDVRFVPGIAAGTVLVVQRSGFAVNGVVKATAQVTVNKAKD